MYTRTIRKSVFACSVFTVLAGFALVTTSCVNEEEEQKAARVEISTVQPSDTVFICTGSASKRFHATDSCSGVSNCTKEVRGVTRAEAEAKKRTFCHTCFRDSINGE